VELVRDKHRAFAISSVESYSNHRGVNMAANAKTSSSFPGLLINNAAIRALPGVETLQIAVARSAKRASKDGNRVILNMASGAVGESMR
jgi:hypothetical protein